MLILLLIFALVRVNPQGAPVRTSNIPQCHCDPVDIYTRDNPNNSHFGTRGRNDIIVSCLVTIFACTWTTIHPNIPAPNESGWNSFKQRVTTMVYALLAPEAITAWAMRQYFGAQRIANVYNTDFANKISMLVHLKYEIGTYSPMEGPRQKCSLIKRIKSYVYEWIHGSPLPLELEEGEMRPWTITHGFFVQMGGFIRCEKGKPVKTYHWYGRIMKDIAGKRIDVPTTESEIQDRSKGDFLSKAIVILQTTWFIVQCIARWSAHLPVTELEVVTLGFAMLNALTYAFWWNKPQSVGVPVYLEMKKPSGAEDALHEETGQVDKSREQSMGVSDMSPVPAVVAGREDARKERKAYWRTMWEAVKEFCLNLRSAWTEEVAREEVDVYYRSFFIRQLHKDRENYARWQLICRMPYALVLTVLRPLAKLLDFSPTDSDKWDLRAPMFHSYGDQNETIFVASSVIASFFGLVHFIPAWFLDFPSRPEKLLWRISAAIITGQPIVLGAWSKWKKGNISWWEHHDHGKSSPLLNSVALAGLPLYIVARLILIALAFLSLRDLSQQALISVDWISFVPHL